MSTSPITIDGSQGEGGGQILRTALGLSMVTGSPFRIENIRAKREKPGLLRQHLTAVRAAAEICSADLDGAEIGSRQLTFRPGKVRPGEYRFCIGSAGSATLVFQAVLPALLMADGVSTLTLEGGTHNPHAPPFEFLDRAFLPILRWMGPEVHVALERAGFYPAGGGRFFATVTPAGRLAPISISGRGAIKRRVAKAAVAGLPGEIAKRELGRIEKMLGWTGDELQIRQLPADQGPGNILTAEIESEHVTEVFTGFGRKGVTAEAVAEDVILQVKRYLAADAAVGPHLADQLLIPLALAGGGDFVTGEPTCHTRTNAEVVGRFLGRSVSITHVRGARYRVAIDGAS